jgi:hypothetical protein
VDTSTFIAKWKDSAASERANKDSFLNDLCDVPGVPRPDPKTGDPDRDRYAAIRNLIATSGGAQQRWTIGRAAAAFKGSRKKEVESVLDSLAALGLLISFDTGEGKCWRATA